MGKKDAQKEDIKETRKSNSNNILLNVGSNIKKAREKKNITQVELIHELYDYGIRLSHDSIISYELGRTNIPSATLFVLACILDMDLNSLKSAIGNELKKI